MTGPGVLRFDTADATHQLRPNTLVAAGYTGRDPAAVGRHIAELAAEGVPAPARVPAFYALPPALLCQDVSVVVDTAHSSGEVEIALVHTGRQLLVTLASDHTDRALERLDVTESKRACPKPIATRAWPLDDALAERWDALLLQSWTHPDDTGQPYQQGTAASLLPPEDLLLRWRQERPDAAEPWVLLCGTVPTTAGVRYSGQFVARLTDPVGRRAIDLHYRVQCGDTLDTGSSRRPA
ncbi:DUF2848 family protein [Dactylosporangium sp. CA-092794]|uniref:DUF2848 family protein n=1 Tax=Dactylosporangium sp. CA-092794 TaxID=3239929 RepID=UPI003D8AEC04